MATVRIHYLRPPDRETVYEQRLVHRAPDVLVTYVERTPLARTLVVDGEVALELGRRVRHEVGALRVGDQRADAFEQPRPLEQLDRERLRAAVVHGHREQARPRMARDHAGQQVEVVVDDVGLDRLRGDVDQARARLPQQEEQEQEPLFIGLLPHAVDGALETERRHHDDGLRVPIHLPDRSPQWHELLLKRRELGVDPGS